MVSVDVSIFNVRYFVNSNIRAWVKSLRAMLVEIIMQSSSEYIFYRILHFFRLFLSKESTIDCFPIIFDMGIYSGRPGCFSQPKTWRISKNRVKLSRGPLDITQTS
mgnify:FL=1